MLLVVGWLVKTITELVRTDKGWKRRSIQYNALYEEGDRSWLEQAAANVAAQSNTAK